MFPEMQMDFETVTSDLEGAEVEQMGKVYLFDFDKGMHVQRDGRLVEIKGIKALEQWIEVQIRSKFKKRAIEALTRQKGLPRDYIRAEFAAELYEGLMVNPQIIEVDDLDIEQIEERAVVRFTAYTALGEIKKEVDIIV